MPGHTATRATEKKEEEPLPLPQNVETWTERQASGRHVLQTGVDVALQELMETRGFANASLVRDICVRLGWVGVGRSNEWGETVLIHAFVCTY